MVRTDGYRDDASMVIHLGDIGDAEEVRNAAARFRAALDQGGLRLCSLANFPRGSCGDTSELLGQYLSDSGFGTWRYRSGVQTDPAGITHAWIERDGLILDITADQFPDISEPVVLTMDRTWHDAHFTPMASHGAADLEWFARSDNRADAQADYLTLRQRADALLPQPLEGSTPD
jgi:hypothetical protein